MFFPEKIVSICKSDKVLEVGPGGTPFERSDVFLDLVYKDEKIAKKQRGNSAPLVTIKPILYYDGNVFPFKDNEFDYIICSHVIEHVDNLPAFMKEIFRVAKKGYIEYPTIIYEYLYNFDVHKNVLKQCKNKLLFCKKTNFPFDFFKPIQQIMLSSLDNGYVDIVDDLKNVMFEGFEWNKPFLINETSDIKALIPEIQISKKIVRKPKKNRLTIKNVLNSFLAR